MSLIERVLVRGVAALGAVALSACYTYVPVERPAPGTSVRVSVPVTSSVGSTRVDREMVTFEGDVVSFGDTLLLQTRSTQAAAAHQEFVLVDTIRVRASEMRDLEERVLSKGRTAALTAVLVGGVALAVAAANGWAGGDDGKPGDIDNPQSSILSRPDSGWHLFGFRIPIPWPSG